MKHAPGSSSAGLAPRFARRALRPRACRTSVLSPCLSSRAAACSSRSAGTARRSASRSSAGIPVPLSAMLMPITACSSSAAAISTFSPSWREAHRIVDQVDQHAPDQILIDVERAAGHWQAATSTWMCASAMEFSSASRALSINCCHRDWLGVDRHPAAFQLGDVEQAVDQPHQAARAFQRKPQHALVILRVFAQALA